MTDSEPKAPMTLPPGRIQPLEQLSTPAIIADKLREAIAQGVLAPGSQLGEVALARVFGVSRGPLREGMQRLTQEGLLVSIRNRGLFVIQMTPENVRDMYLARGVVERAAATSIFLRDPAAAGDKLLLVIKRMQMAARKGRGDHVGEADIEFHQMLVSLAESTRLTRMHKTLLTETRMCIRAQKDTYADHKVRITEHRAIAEAFKNADPVRTDALLMRHMEDAMTRLTGPDV